jgi:hypothetical protein
MRIYFIRLPLTQSREAGKVSRSASAVNKNIMMYLYAYFYLENTLPKARCFFMFNRTLKIKSNG